MSLAAWCFLEGIHQIQQELYTHHPHALGYQLGPPKWWSLPILGIGALIVALAIRFLPGNGATFPPRAWRPVAPRPPQSCRA
ncbi:MAG: hypothetical protein JO286_04350 [Solirubrobacterales bacterium]|nr:hypothetical protein [Solirubrobacterales bacterium]